jgi:2-aminoadipate transaminase
MKEASMKVFDELGSTALQYSSTDGYLPLREKLAKRMFDKQQIKTDAEHILMTAGSQMGLDFSGRVFLNEGDVVLLEAPSYLGAINAFKANQPKFVAIPTDDEGMLIDELKKAIEENDNIKFCYVIPDFQNPTGKVWSLERRKQFMEVMTDAEIPVVEDNPYGELRFEGTPQPSLKTMDPKGLVIYLGTMSKILAPGQRLGWVCAEDEILEKYNIMEQASALQASTISQMEVNAFMDMYNLDDHIKKILPAYDSRRKCMIAAMEKYLPEGCKFTRSEGGLFTWIEAPESVDMKALQPECIKRGVAYVPGAPFFPNGGGLNTARLNYSAEPEERIEEGIKIIGDAIKEVL